MQACEIGGFNTGAFEFKIVSNGKLDASGVPWRLLSDFDMVIVADDAAPAGARAAGKSILPLCKYLHRLATLKGLAELTVREHSLSPKMQAPFSLLSDSGNRVCRSLFDFIS